MTRSPGAAPSRAEHGAVAIMVAIIMTALVVVAAMVLDFGLVRMDRQINKAAADSAAISGAQAASDAEAEKLFAWRGACNALAFLKSNHRQLGSLTGTWKKGNGGAPASPDPCALAATEQTLECLPITSDPTMATWARFRGVAGDIIVDIKAGYEVTDGGFSDEAHINGDGSLKGGCDQVAVIVQQTRDAGLGSIAGVSDLTTRTRSVGRVLPPKPPEDPVALLLLERNNCTVLDNNGVGTRVLVMAAGDSPGRIHADSLGNGADCGTGSQIINGNVTNGVIAEQNTSTTPAKPGAITLYALRSVPGAVPGKAYDDPPAVISRGQVGDKPIPGKLVTRSVVDKPYRVGVQETIAAANAAWNTTPISGVDKVVTHCSDATHASVIGALNHPGTVYFNCGPGGASGPLKYGTVLEFKAQRVIINDAVQLTGGGLSFPNAREVYIRGTSSPVRGLDVGSNVFRMNQASFGATCPEALRFGQSAKMVIGYGGISVSNGTNSLFQLCNTAVVLMGDGPGGTGCVPGIDGTAPVDPGTVCDAAVLNSTGGRIEWTAPNQTEDAALTQTLWRPALEDLALWTESATTAHSVGGNGNMHLAGVFMIPNADYFTINGGGSQDVENSQYIVRRLRVTGGAYLKMSPNPEDSVKIAVPGGIALVR